MQILLKLKEKLKLKNQPNNYIIFFMIRKQFIKEIRNSFADGNSRALIEKQRNYC